MGEAPKHGVEFGSGRAVSGGAGKLLLDIGQLGEMVQIPLVGPDAAPEPATYLLLSTLHLRQLAQPPAAPSQAHGIVAVGFVDLQ